MDARTARQAAVAALLVAASLVLAAGVHSWLAHRHAAPAAAVRAGNRPRAIANEYDLLYDTNHRWLALTPSPFLVATVRAAGAPPAGARALDIGCGNGRNALYLARQGYRVTGVDLSRAGLSTTRELARAYHLPVRTVAQDINAYPIGRRRWDLITLIDFPFPYRALLPRIAAGLRPGGVVVIQAVSSQQGILRSPDHQVTYTLMLRGDLNAPFAGFAVLHDTEAEQATMWGSRAIMIRYAARAAGPR